MKTKLLFILMPLFFCAVYGQQKKLTFTGNIPELPDAKVSLIGFNALNDTLLVEGKSDSQGKFVLEYPAAYRGAAVLAANETKIIVLLDHEPVAMTWKGLQQFESIVFQSKANELLSKAMNSYTNSQSRKMALEFLLPLYQNDTFQKAIEAELKKQDITLGTLSANLPSNSYVAYYVKYRKLLSDMQSQQQPLDALQVYDAAFAALDFTDERLLKSGLLSPLLESYFLLHENNYQTEWTAMKGAVDKILQQCSANPSLKVEIAAFLFTLFEKRSLFAVSEHLSQRILEDGSCSNDHPKQALFEQYRKMAKGQTAPDIDFGNHFKNTGKLSGLDFKYKLVVFGSGYCDKCRTEIPEFLKYYDNLKATYNLELVFISLDTDKEVFEDFTATFPWLTFCDYKGWETTAARDYYVYATPTMYLLDRNNKILVKPISAAHTEAWLKHFNSVK